MDNKYLDLKDRYTFTCCVCRTDHVVMPSIFMGHFQVNEGGAFCPKCHTKLRLQIDENNDRMLSTIDGATRSCPPLPEACYKTKGGAESGE